MPINVRLTPVERAVKKKWFPRVPWTKDGPVRRRYLVRAAEEGRTAEAVLEELAATEGFTAPDRPAVIGDAPACLDVYLRRETAGMAGLVIGRGLDAFWCDLALGEPGTGGWRELIVRSETGENLVALAHAVGVLRFRKWET